MITHPPHNPQNMAKNIHCTINVFLSFFALCVNRARRAIEPGHRLVATLRYMATGEMYRASLRFNHLIAHNTLSKIIREVSVAIYETYKPEVWVLPSTPEGWKEVADGFSTRWNFHHCVGAIDGKHIKIVKPKKSGGDYYNYKGFHSIVMMAVTDANYCFQWVNVGSPGRNSDAGIFKKCTLRKALERDRVGLPPPEPLPNGTRPIPYFLVGDEAFPLNTWLMKKYPTRGVTHGQRIFNYRSSRARLVVENSFGILANRWRCLTTTMHQEPQNVTKIVLGCLTLHNVLRKKIPLRPGEVDAEDAQGNVVRGAWRDEVHLMNGRNGRGNQNNNAGKEVRDYLRAYYNAPVGAVAWQERAIDVQRYRRPLPPRPEPPRNSSESDSD